MEVEGSKKDEDSATYCGFDISALPDELFEHILMFVPAKDVVKRCSLVCKHWFGVSRDPAYWKRRCEAENKYIPQQMVLPPEDFVLVYFKDPYKRNLLCNTHAESKEHWDEPVTYLPVKVEAEPVGADSISDYIPAKEIQGKIQNWVTSYNFSKLTQKVNLLDVGCSETVLDILKPPINVSAWCTARWDCGAKFQLVVMLLDGNCQTLHNIQKDMNLVDHADRRIWHKVEHTFIDYQPGVRNIEFSMGGKDTQYWAGYYGSKFTLPCVRFVV